MALRFGNLNHDITKEKEKQKKSKTPNLGFIKKILLSHVLFNHFLFYLFLCA